MNTTALKIPELHWKLKPFEHQLDMAAWHYANRNSLDLSEVGCCKTAPLITVMDHLVKRKAVERILVIAPNTILDNWVNELKAWSDLSHVVLRGTKQKRLDLLQQRNLADVYLINYEGVRVVFAQLMAMNFDLVVCDEIHHIKNWRGSRKTPTQSFLVRELGRHARARKGLTGTALTNSIEDLWAIGRFIDPAIFATNFWGFRNRYMYNENADKPWLKFPKWVARSGAVEDLKGKLAPYAIRFEKREVLKFLPPVLFQKRTVTLSDEQRRVYSKLKHDFVVELNDGEELAALHILGRVVKLLEVCSGFVYIDREKTFHPGSVIFNQPSNAVYRFERNAKLEELRNVLEEIGDRRVVIWTAYQEEAALIGQVLAKLGGPDSFLFVTGNTPQDARQGIVDRFNRGEIRYLVCNASCAGEGLTILAPYAVYFSRGWKLGERLQSLGRHDRPGSEQFENVTIIDLVAGDTIDEEVMMALERKEDLMKTVNPESFRRMLG